MRRGDRGEVPAVEDQEYGQTDTQQQPAHRIGRLAANQDQAHQGKKEKGDDADQANQARQGRCAQCRDVVEKAAKEGGNREPGDQKGGDRNAGPHQAALGSVPNLMARWCGIWPNPSRRVPSGTGVRFFTLEGGETRPEFGQHHPADPGRQRRGSAPPGRGLTYGRPDIRISAVAATAAPYARWPRKPRRWVESGYARSGALRPNTGVRPSSTTTKSAI